MNLQKDKKRDVSKYSLAIILVLMIVVSSILSEDFLSLKNFTNILKQVSIVTICSFAQGMIIISGEIDLSIGYLAGMAGTFACIIYVSTNNIIIAFISGVLIGALIGFLNGIFVSKCKLPSFLVTLAMQQICFGIINAYTGGQSIYQIGGFNVLGQGKFLNIPVPVVFMVIMFIITHMLLKYLKFGRYLYAIGGNSEAAEAAGIPVKRIVGTIYIISGIFAAIAGMVMMGRLNAGIPGEGAGMETDAITAAVIGGTSFSGGEGSAFGILIGSMIIGILNNIMNLMGVNSFIQMIVKGLIIILAVLLDTVSKQRSSKVKLLNN